MIDLYVFVCPLNVKKNTDKIMTMAKDTTIFKTKKKK